MTASRDSAVPDNSGVTGHVFRTAAASFATYNVAAMALWLQPAVVAEFLDVRGFSSAQAGLIASLEMIVIAGTMMLWTAFGPSISYRRLALAGVGATMLASAGCLVVSDFAGLVALRALAAMGFGLAMLVPSMAIAGLAKPEKLYARMYTLSLICSSALLAALPGVALLFSRPPAFPTFLLYSAILLPAILLMPAGSRTVSRSPVHSGENIPDRRRHGRPTLYLAIGISSLGLTYASVWAFFIFLGGRAGLTPAQASTAAALSLVAAIAGSLLSGVISARAGQVPTMLGSAIAMTAGILTTILVNNPIAFRAGGMMTLLALYILIPTVLGAAARTDPSGRGVAFVNAAVVLVGAAGPYIGGVINDIFGFAGMGAVAVATLMVSLGAFIFFQRSGRLQA